MITRLLSGSTGVTQRARRNRHKARSLQMEQLEERCVMSADPVLFWNGVMLQAAVNDYAIGAPGLQFGPTRTSAGVRHRSGRGL